MFQGLLSLDHPTKDSADYSFNMLRLAALTLSLVAQRVLGHGGVIGYGIAGVYYSGWQPYNTPTGQSSIERPWSS